MITPKELARLLQRAVADKTEEPAFFRALLDALVYAHAPRNDRHGRVRLIQFTTPKGLTVLPFFSDEPQATAAAGSAAVNVVMMTGRQLFELTRGATLMLNPNETNCIIYPEEISALLDHGQVALVERIDTGEQRLWVRATSSSPNELIERLIALYKRLGSIEAAYLGEIGIADETEARAILIATAVPPRDAERVARATMTELQVQDATLEMDLDFTSFDPDTPPAWLNEARLKPFYIRSIGSTSEPSGSLH